MQKAAPEPDLLLGVVRAPSRMLSLAERDWDRLLPRARAAELIARLAEDAQALGFADRLPSRVQSAFASVRIQLAQQIRATRWEIDRVGLTLSRLSLPTILLKGAAYIVRDLPLARRRFSGDVDILVPWDRLGEVERALHGDGWRQQGTDEYDELYYRRWMHELPPMVHLLRGSVLDVHHAILPRTTRHSPPTEKLLSELWMVGNPDAEVVGALRCTLSARDMILHSAAHLFHDSYLKGGLRGLADLHDLVAQFSAQPGFWDGLVARAVELRLGRSLFYGMRYAHRLLGTPIPSGAWSAIGRTAPPAPVLTAMDALVGRAFVPSSGERPRRGELSVRLLYVRSHLLRMPLHLLVPHLIRKATRRAREETG